MGAREGCAPTMRTHGVGLGARHGCAPTMRTRGQSVGGTFSRSACWRRLPDQECGVRQHGRTLFGAAGRVMHHRLSCSFGSPFLFRVFFFLAVPEVGGSPARRWPGRRRAP